MPVREPTTLSDRIGGRWSISLRGAVITAFLVPLAVVAEVITDPASVWIWLLAMFCGMLLGTLVPWIAHLTLFRHRAVRPVPAVWSLMLFGLIAAVFSVTFMTVAQHLGARPKVTLWEAVVSDVVVAIWWGVMLTIILHEIDAAQQTKKQVMDTALRDRMMRDREARDVASAVRDVHHAVSADLEPIRVRALDTIDEYLRAPASVETGVLSDTLRSAVEDIRPISHRWWGGGDIRYPRPSLIRWVRLTVDRALLRPWLLLMFYLVNAIPEALASTNVTGELMGVGIGIIIIFGVCGAANGLMRRYPRSHRTWFLAGTGVLQATTILAGIVDGLGVVEIAAAVLLGVFVILLSSGVSTWPDVREEMVTAYLESAERADLDQMAAAWWIAETSREAARFVHGTVQGRLAACAWEIDRCVAAADGPGLQRAVQQARAVLAEPVVAALVTHRDPPSGTRAIVAEVQRRVGQWQGLGEISIDTSRIADTDVCDVDAQLVGRVVEEGIANAVRHGGARHIAVKLAPTDDGLVRVDITDDGSGPGKGRPGIGSAILDQAAPGAWSLSAGERGSVLTAVVSG